MRRALVLAALLAAAAAIGFWMTQRPDEPPERNPSAAPRPDGASAARKQPRRRSPEPAPATPPSIEEPQTVPRPAVLPAVAERKFLTGRTAAEIVAPFADVRRRPGRERFQESMVPGGAWTQLCDIVDEDFDRAVASYTKGFLATVERGGPAVDADQRRRVEECEKDYWRVIVDLQQRSSALYDRLRDRDYRDDAERDALELERARIGGVADDLNHERIKAETEILKTTPR
jgi:hypothetical protein